MFRFHASTVFIIRKRYTIHSKSGGKENSFRPCVCERMDMPVCLKGSIGEKMVVYLDVFFAINFVMDLLVLLTVRKITNENKSLFRIIVAAVIGGIYACFILVSGMKYGIIEGFFTYVIMSILLTIIAFGYDGIVKTAEMILMLFVVTFVTSGIINTLYFRNIISDIKDLVVSAFAIMLVITVSLKFIRKREALNTKIVDVKIINGEQEVSVKALIDTGNSLIEPINRKPVAVLASKPAGKIKKGVEKGGFVIPYKSVGKEHGILMGFMADYMEITDKRAKNRGIIKISRPIIAEYDGRFTESDEYQMLLHPQMMDNAK